jgi:hypothetical protein
MRYISTPQGLVPAHLYRRPERQRSDLPAPMLVRDQIDPLWHPSDGREYESKSEFRSITRQHGGIEVGNDRQEPAKHVDMSIKDDVGTAIQMLREGYKPQVTETAKEGWSDV